MATIQYSTSTHENTVLEELGQRLAQRRIELDLTQAELADIAGVGKRTLERLEGGGSTQLSNFLRIVRHLELLPEFMAAFPDAQPSPMELLRAKGKERKRVRHKKKKANSVVREEPSGWTWGE
jgi:transcriptional regulator with XRE-family HTH domain